MKIVLPVPFRGTLTLAVATLLALTLCQSQAQTIQSTDLLPAIKSLVDTVSAAETGQNETQSNVLFYINVADVFENQSKDMRIPIRGRAEARLNAIDLKIKACTVSFDAASQNADVLVRAQVLLRQIHNQLGDGANQRGGNPTNPKCQLQIDEAMTNLNFGCFARIDNSSAEALRSAREFYRSACIDGFTGGDWYVTLNGVEQHLSAWTEHNQEVLVTTGTMLRKLEVERADAVIAQGSSACNSDIGRLIPPSEQTAVLVPARPPAWPQPVIASAGPSYYYPVQPKQPRYRNFRVFWPPITFSRTFPPRMTFGGYTPVFPGATISISTVWPHSSCQVISAPAFYYLRGNRSFR